MPRTKSSLSSIVVALTHFPLFCRLIKQLDIIATKFRVCAMALTHATLQCIIHTFWINASFKYHVTMEDTHNLACFSLRHRPDIFWTSCGLAFYSLSTVTHARVFPADQDFASLYHGTRRATSLYAARTNKCLCTLGMTCALPSPDNLLGAPLMAATFGLCTVSNT